MKKYGKLVLVDLAGSERLKVSTTACLKWLIVTCAILYTWNSLYILEWQHITSVVVADSDVCEPQPSAPLLSACASCPLHSLL